MVTIDYSFAQGSTMSSKTSAPTRAGLFAVAFAITVAAGLGTFLAPAAQAPSSWIWVEGELPQWSTMHRHPYWYDKVKHEQLSGGDFISNFDKAEAGEASYKVVAPSPGAYEFWVRANPVGSRLEYGLNDGSWVPIDLEKHAQKKTNIADDEHVDLRYLAWVKVGKIPLRKGDNTIRFRMDSKDHHHGSLDCFALNLDSFDPTGVVKPDQREANASRVAQERADSVKREAEDSKNWLPFTPGPDSFSAKSAIDLRRLNEKVAGEGGFIGVDGSHFIHSQTRKPIRFWAVNGPPSQDRAGLQQEARSLAKRGVNLVRIHHGYFDEKGDPDMKAIHHALDIVEAMKAEGIYSLFSIYFPLWMSPKSDTPWLPGYDGKTNPFATLYFNKDFQSKYREWWKALLLTRNKSTGKRLVDEPAVAGAEMINEDSYFFWTFNEQNIPDPELRMLEAQFGAWLTKRYGSMNATFQAWQGLKLDRDRPAEGRIGFRPLWNMAHEKTPRDRDTVRFLFESQRHFYQETYRFLRELGFKGTITASNWVTASPEIFGPLEKASYLVGDFIDRHGYFACHHKGDNAEWSIRDGHTYGDRSALRFDPEEPGKPRSFVHPAMDPSYNGKPSMISETTWNRPNRYRSEAPLFYAAYGALQDSDAIVHFAFDGNNWSVKPNFFMQPWTLMSPAMMGQFPAAALIYRQGLVSPGDTLVDVNLSTTDLLNLKGTPLPQDAAFDELRLRDIPRGKAMGPDHTIDPLVHFAGRTNVQIGERGGPAKLKDLAPYIDHQRQVVTSTNRQVRLDYGQGILMINAPAAQGVSGALHKVKTHDLKDLSVTSPLELGHIIAVSLDGLALAESRKILLQAMSEEKATSFRTEPAAPGIHRIVSIGHDPWLVRALSGVVKFKRSDAASLKVTALDPNGEPVKCVGTAQKFALEPDTLYYLITP